MPSVIRHTAVWTGAPGLPGYSQFYQEVTGTVSSQAQAAQYAILGLFIDLVAYIPDAVTVTVDPVYQVVDVATGEIVGEGTVATPMVNIPGTYVGGWNAQIGILVEWLTDAFISGRRLRGRTYLVPLGNMSEDDGTVPDAVLADVRAAATALVAALSDFVVWHRPVSGAGGQVSSVVGSSVRDKAAVLRSRMV